jgi:phenylalanine-4-hydroxylase
MEIDRMKEIAARHGLDWDSVNPLPLRERVEVLAQCLERKDVPFPIDPVFGKPYLQAAMNGVPFAVGGLCDDTVDLGEFRNEQHYDRYSLEEHLSWAVLVAEQQKTKHRYACREYLDGESTFAIGGTVIPDYYLLNARIYQQTGWQLATVNMIIPAELFFTCHSHRFFPVTTLMRGLEQDYLQEPDIGHDVAGHVSTFTIPVVAHVMQNHGVARNLIYEERNADLETEQDETRRSKIMRRADELLLYAERIYWFTVEFGLVLQDGETRAFGAGILSSPGETTFSIDSPIPNRILIDPSREKDLLRLATTDYLISEYQKTYFVTERFDLLETLTPERIVSTAKAALRLPHFSWRDIVPGDRVLHVGQTAVSTNEKYFRLMADVRCDDCLTRTAIRNLRWFARRSSDGSELAQTWYGPVAPVPERVQAWFVEHASDRALQVPLRPLSESLGS